jgi:hypothetical protein
VEVSSQLLSDELRTLVGYGARPLRLVTLPELRQLSGADKHAERLTARQCGGVMRAYIAHSIESLGGIHVVWGEYCEAHRLHRALRLLLKFEGTGQDATNRRARVLNILNLPYPVSQMRRPDSPERDLLSVLATHMVRTA